MERPYDRSSVLLVLVALLAFACRFAFHVRAPCSCTVPCMVHGAWCTIAMDNGSLPGDYAGIYMEHSTRPNPKLRVPPPHGLNPRCCVMLRLGNVDVALCCVVLRCVASDVAFGFVSGRCVSLRFVTSDVTLRVTFNMSQDARSMLRYVTLGVALSATSALGGLVALCCVGGCVMLLALVVACAQRNIGTGWACCVMLRWGLLFMQHNAT